MVPVFTARPHLLPLCTTALTITSIVTIVLSAAVKTIPALPSMTAPRHTYAHFVKTSNPNAISLAETVRPPLPPPAAAPARQLFAGPQCNCFWFADWRNYDTISGLAMHPPVSPVLPCPARRRRTPRPAASIWLTRRAASEAGRGKRDRTAAMCTSCGVFAMGLRCFPGSDFLLPGARGH